MIRPIQPLILTVQTMGTEIQSTNFWGGTTVEQCIAVADSCSKNCFQKEVSNSFYQGSMKLFKKNSSSTWPSTSFISVSPLVLYMIKRKIIYFQTFVFCLSCEFFSVLFSTICLCGKNFFSNILFSCSI